MSKSQHNHTDAQMTQNQNNQMSDDPRDGSRDSFTLGKDAKSKEPNAVSPEEQAQDQSQIEAFGEEGAGIAAKE
jgi:hypothetical protein